MKILKTIKNNEVKKTTFWGINIYEQKYDFDKNLIKYQKFLNGLITTCKNNDYKNNFTEKNINFLGKKLIKITEKDDICEYYLFNARIKSIRISQKFYNKYKKYFKEKYDDFYIINANSGEACLFLSMLIDSFMKKRESKNPLIIATKKYHVDLIRMLCPEFSYVLLENLNLNIKKDEFSVGNKRFFIIFTHAYFAKTEQDIKTKQVGQAHYFNSMLKRLKLTENDINKRIPKVSEKASNSVIKKAKKIGLNLNNFIFIAPEAQSCMPIDYGYLKERIKKYKAEGLDIYLNLKSNNNYYTQLECKSLNLSLTEAYILAKHSKKILALRSGLCELLTFTNKPIEIVYTKFRYRHLFEDMDVNNVISGFTMMLIPNIDKSKISEFDLLNRELIK